MYATSFAEFPRASSSASSSRSASPSTGDESRGRGSSYHFKDEPSQSPRSGQEELSAWDAASAKANERQFDIDVEKRPLSQGVTSSLPSSKAAALITVYFCLNLGLTFYNKTLLNSFPYPYFITAIHAGGGIVGCSAVRVANSKAFRSFLSQRFAGKSRVTEDSQEERMAFLKDEESKGSVSKQTSDNRDVFDSSHAVSALRKLVLLAYSALYAANIAVSNASLGLVSVPFHQIIRSTCPLFTAALGLAILAKKPATGTLWALVPVVFGAAMSCFGELSFTSAGFLLTLLGTILAAFKTVATNLLQGGGRRESKPESEDAERTRATDTSALQYSASAILGSVLSYSPLELLALMSPLACVQCLLVSAWTGELSEVSRHFFVIAGDDVANSAQIESLFNTRLALILAGNGMVAFALNLVSFNTNRTAGPLAMTVIGNLKQVTTIVLAVWLYGTVLNGLNAIGIAIALCGTTWYGYEALKAKKAIKT